MRLLVLMRRRRSRGRPRITAARRRRVKEKFAAGEQMRRCGRSRSLWHAWRMGMGALDIAIVGYGTAGQAAAIYLERHGHRVQVFERSAVLGPLGAGILVQPTGLSVLADLGLLGRALACGAPVHRLAGTNP